MSDLAPWEMLSRPALMGVVNLNDDSFSDPHEATSPDARIARARAVVEAGADLLDLGAQSAALAARLVPPEEQVAVLVPVVESLVADGTVVSVDTYDQEIAVAVLEAGAQILNDFSGAPQRRTIAAVVAHDARYVLTHNPVGPRRRQTDADAYDDVVGDTIAALERQLDLLTSWGLSPARVVVDPGIDVGKTPAQTLELLRGRARIAAAFDVPLLWAISRKDVVGAITRRPPSQRDPGTLALLEAVADLPRSVVRVHDVAGALDFLAVRDALAGRRDLTADELLDDRLRREA